VLRLLAEEMGIGVREDKDTVVRSIVPSFART
jgi:hypothetical protein